MISLILSLPSRNPLVISKEVTHPTKCLLSSTTGHVNLRIFSMVIETSLTLSSGLIYTNFLSINSLAFIKQPL